MKMPSASAKLEKQTSIDTNDPVKQVLTVVEKKVRNLEKRKAKLDSYKSDSQKGKELNEDQKKAVEKYDQVVELLEFAKDLQKQFQTVIQDCTKAQKKAAKHEQLERAQQERHRIKEFLVYQDLLSSMGGEDVRQDFLSGNKGAVKLSEEELNSIDELYKVICPERDPESGNNSEFDNLLTTSSEHIQSLLDAKNKEAFGTTYKSLREILQKIYTCSYFNKSEAEAQDEEESNVDKSDEKECDKSLSEQFGQQPEAYSAAEVEDFTGSSKNEVASSQIDSSFYQIENSSLYTEQPHPIQEVLSVQGNLNFLQESQIEVETPSRVEPQIPSSLAPVNYSNVEFSAATQSMPASLVSHRTRRASEETSTMSNHPATSNLVLANSASIQQQQPNITSPVPLQPTSQPVDFDPARPIPTQTYTNQSFTSAIHPMIAVPPNYVPVTLPHTISPAHVMPANMVVPQQPLPQRSSVTSPPIATNPNSLPISAAHTSVSGLSSAPAHSQQANIYSLCLKMNQLSNETSPAAHVSSPQYECSEIPESNMNKSSATFGNGAEAHNIGESRSRAGSNPYVRGPNQMEYRNDRAYQSTNNSQAYMNRETFADNSSYSSNLKRGLNSRGAARSTSGAPRAANNPRGGRVGYRN